MNQQSDSQLLRAYAQHRSEPAFAELVRRHVDFTYSAAVRMVCDPHLAEDVTQGVFVALAKNADQLTGRPVLSGWLHRTVQNIAAQTVRTIERRRAREQEAVAMNELLATDSDFSWKHIAPHLDAALSELSEPDRDALLLRYFERKSASEMAQTLGITNDAAQKRVSRAVERLRELFAKRGVTIGTSGLAVVITANAVQAAPVGLALTISTAALTGTTIATTATITTTKAIAMTALQKAIVTATVFVLAGAEIYETHQASELREKVQTFQQQQSPLMEQIEQMNQALIDATNQLAALRDDNERLNRNTVELLKLRGEIGVLRQTAMEEKQNNQAQVLPQNVLRLPAIDHKSLSEARQVMAWDNVMVTGGWKPQSSISNRVYIFTIPRRGSNNSQIRIDAQLIECPDAIAKILDLDEIKTPASTETKSSKLLTRSQFADLLKIASDSDGAKITSVLSINTFGGQQAQIRFTDIKKTLSGEEFDVGPVVNFLPTISEDGQTIEMKILAHPNDLVPFVDTNH